MQDLVEYADEKWKTIQLSPDGYQWSSVPRLKEFYKRFWFVENKWKNKDFSISRLMYRRPPKKITGGH